MHSHCGCMWMTPNWMLFSKTMAVKSGSIGVKCFLSSCQSRQQRQMNFVVFLFSGKHFVPSNYARYNLCWNTTLLHQCRWNSQMAFITVFCSWSWLIYFVTIWCHFWSQCQHSRKDSGRKRLYPPSGAGKHNETKCSRACGAESPG